MRSEKFRKAMNVNEDDISQLLSLIIDEHKINDISSETSKTVYGDETSVEEIKDDDDDDVIIEENEQSLELCKKATKFYKGDGVSVNKKEASRLYKESADNGCK